MMEHNHTAVDTGNFFTNLLQVYVPRSQCMFHEKDLIALHIVSDLLIAFSYYSIPIALIYFARRRKDLAYNWMFIMFAMFIILCGTTHIFSIVAIWMPVYRLDGVIKMITGLISIATAFQLWRLMPHALALPSQMEIAQRKEELEVLVAQRTAELTEANEALKNSEEKFKTLAENAEAANRTKSEFLANMSHELRTPMNAVVGLSNILSMNKALPSKEAEMVRTLQLSAQTLLGLINDLLDISKIESNRLQIESIPFQLSEVINEVFSVLSVKAEEKNIALECDYAPAEKDYYLGDPLRIRQILINLVSNAIKFTQEGKVTVVIAPLKVSETQSDFTITVTDTGIGIPKDKLDTIFDKFVQADTSITRKYGGTGLGLAISKSLAEMMHGDITVKSKYGHGAEFTLHLPLQCVKEKKGIAETVANLLTRKVDKRRVLLVEDYKPNVMVAQSLLEELGYLIDVAVSGKEALAVLGSNRESYTAVLMDIQMPDMDGLEATYFIREEEKQKNLPRLPIIAMTAHALLGDKERCLDAGMDDYISKPFQPEELEQALSRIAQPSN
ncbi:MAG: ATP-binding protein [Rickettsiales bacterium]